MSVDLDLPTSQQSNRSFYQLIVGNAGVKFGHLHYLHQLVHDIITIPILITISLVVGAISFMGDREVALALLVVAAMVFIFSAVSFCYNMSYMQ